MSETHAPSGLLPWLKATIEGDKATAERATAGRWTVAIDDRGRWRVDVARWNDYCHDYEVTGKIVRPRNFRDAEHIALHDPRDTIARCKADLALLDEHPPAEDVLALPIPPVWHGRCGGCGELAPCTTVRLLASGFRHRPGFKPEWTDLP